MKAIGIIRKLDNLGRIVIPKELRDRMNLEEGTPLEIFIDDYGNIVLKKYESNCTFCGSDNLCVEFNGKKVCKECIEKLDERI